MLQRTLPAGFIAPCLPTKTTNLPSCDQWLHEIKHDGFRIIARKSGVRVRLYNRLAMTSPIASRSSLTRWPACAHASLMARSVCCGENGVASFDLIHHRGITIRRGCGRHKGQHFHVRFFFPDAISADALCARFGGRRLTYSSVMPGQRGKFSVSAIRSIPAFDCWRGNGINLAMLSTARHENGPRPTQ